MNTALILGLGESGLAMARWLAREGWMLRIADTRSEPPMLAALKSALPQAEFVGGDFSAALLDGVQLLALSPGLAPEHSEAAPLVQAAAGRGIEVVGEIELFARALRRLGEERAYKPRIVGITGTNGKTTTTVLTGLLIDKSGVAGKNGVAVAGNISPTALDTLRERLDLASDGADDLPQVWVLELSSFQLATTTSLACDAATVLNLTQDHLDWHGSMEAYAAAKARIFGARTARVLNRDDPWVIKMQPEPVKPAPKARPSKAKALKAFKAEEAKSTVALPQSESAAHEAALPADVAPEAAPPTAATDEVSEPLAVPDADAVAPATDAETGEGLAPVHAADHVERALKRERELPPPVITFGAGAPSQPDEYGLARDGGLMWLAYTEDLSMGHRRRKAAGELPGIEGQVHVHRLMPTEALKIRGRHNALNALAALALARAIGCPLAPMLHALRHYSGEPHRVQPVAVVDGVHYIDDSKGTNVGATVAALEGLGNEGRKLVVILGGEGKGQDFAPLVGPLAAFARGVVLIGRDGTQIGAVLRDAAYPVHQATTLPEAVELAAGVARSGDVVLLSPACASLDMFRNYKHRAEVFVAAVRELATEKGQVL
jgi:UDP-N-acetylmuramoylalanine--D-glutamate ligase